MPIREQQRGPRFAEGAAAKLLRRSEEGAGGLVRRSVEASRGSSVASDGSRGGAGAGGGKGGVLAAGRVRGDGGGGGAAAGAQRADQDRALRPEEGRPQGRPGALVRTATDLSSSSFVSLGASTPSHHGSFLRAPGC